MFPKILTALFVLFWSSQINAQVSDTVFQQFKYRFQQYRFLNIGFSLNNNTLDLSPLNSSTPLSHESSSALNTNFRYLRNHNSDKLQQSVTIFGGLSASHTLNKDKINIDKGSDLSNAVACNMQNRFYDGNKFLELNFLLNQTAGFSTKNRNYLILDKANNSTYTNISVGAGLGRLEFVSNLMQSLFILEDFKRNNIIGSYNDADALNLARSITQIYNTRIIDFRYRLKGQLRMLDSSLKATGLIKTNVNPSHYFINMIDNWLFNQYFTRYDGRRFSAGLMTTDLFYYNHLKQHGINIVKSTDKILYHGFQPAVYFNYISEKAVNLNWQKSWFMGLTISKAYVLQTRKRQIGNDPVFWESFTNNSLYSTINLGFKYGWFPNSRTNINGGINYATFYYLSGGQNRHLTSYLNPQISLFYFVNPKLSFNATLSPAIFLFSNKAPNSSYFGFNSQTLSAGFNYSIF